MPTTKKLDITFNTGRLYQSDGQVIRAVFDDQSGKVVFNDFSRGIWGAIDPGLISMDSERAAARGIMRQYDLGNYDWPRMQALPKTPGDEVLKL